MDSRTRPDREELLAELVRQQRRTLWYTRLVCLASIILLSAACAGMFRILPVVMRTVQRAENTMAEVETMVSNVNQLLEENGDALTEAVGKLNSLDTEQLNEAIGQLSDAAGPLSQLSGLFGAFGGT